MLQYRRWFVYGNRNTLNGGQIVSKMSMETHDGWFLLGLIPLYTRANIL